MMHDFAVSYGHSIILDLPLSLDPLNLAKNRPAVVFDPKGKSRFGVFPRAHPDAIRWFESDNACCIFHTANAWEEFSEAGNVETVNLLACRLNSATLVFSAGNVSAPAVPFDTTAKKPELCQLYYYQFQMGSSTCHPNSKNTISQQWALSTIPFEFPTLSHQASMGPAHFIYGCSMIHGSFDAALGRAAKIDCLVKIDVEALIRRGIEEGPINDPSVGPTVDTRTVTEILESDDVEDDPIRIFKLPSGWCAQEATFVPDLSRGNQEDDGWLLTYVFDESQLEESTGEAPPGATSELWVVDAKNMKDIICRVKLPQRGT